MGYDVESLIENLGKAEDPWDVDDAIEHLVQLEEDAIPSLRDALYNADTRMSERIARTLLESGRVSAEPILLDALECENPIIRVAVANAICLSGKTVFSEAMGRLLQDKEPGARVAAIKWIEEHDIDDAIPSLIRIVSSDDNDWVRSISIEALGHMQVFDAVPVIIQALYNGEVETRQYAAKALWMAKSRGQTEEAIHALLKIIGNDESVWVRAEAALTLGSLQSPNAFSVLADLLSNDKAPQVRGNAATGLASLGEQRAKPILSMALNDEDKSVQHAAAEALKALERLADKEEA